MDGVEEKPQPKLVETKPCVVCEAKVPVTRKLTEKRTAKSDYVIQFFCCRECGNDGLVPVNFIVELMEKFHCGTLEILEKRCRDYDIDLYGTLGFFGINPEVFMKDYGLSEARDIFSDWNPVDGDE